MKLARALIAPAALLLALTGCAGGTATTEPTESVAAPASEAPIETTAETTAEPKDAAGALSDEEALQVGMDTYTDMYDAMFVVAENGHDNDGKLAALITGEQLEKLPELIASFENVDVKVEGSADMRNPQLISNTHDGTASTIDFAVCVDATGMTLSGSDGASEPGPLTTSHVTVTDADGAFKVSNVQTYTDQDLCA
ncbi:hypothetical protein EG850_04510 [Gulosibacter macacae]|uniref:Lipoprotein n=1 Tax=Gulosibacter macacae TaxID=2488791 RepID=A0A3P3W1K5_9MICO|nr:hypothetical protein [Gulosibacter macacae]RRJ87569.1 hypothetical protein EG850_04510 [Gulosibacter macacae]